MPRLVPLALVLALFALPTLANAQSPKATAVAPSKDTVLFDFESGSFDGWTVSGECWEKQPATPKTFADKAGQPLVSGIVGNGYLTTLHPKLGIAAIGKAVSKDFPIDKPFLTFKIGGGHYPKEACLNLVVDGKIVRTETGNDSPDLRPAYWDVYALMGKTAHLEVVDATPSQQRGYIMVDDLRLSERAPIAPQNMLEQLGIRPQFLEYSRFYENDEQRKRGRYLHFGVREDQFDQMIDEVYLQMNQERYRAYAGIPLSKIAGYVEEVVRRVEEQGEKYFSTKPSLLGHQWLLAEAACAWVIQNVEYDNALVEAIEAKRVIDNDFVTSATETLKTYPPKNKCSGYAVLLREVARAVGLKSYVLQGKIRNPNSPPDLYGGHCWTEFVFTGELHIPADTTTSGQQGRKDIKRVGGKVYGYKILPRRREEWELYHATHYSWSPIPRNITAHNDPRESVVMLRISEDEWKSTDKTYYISLDKQIRVRAEGR